MEAATFRIWTQASEPAREFELERDYDHPVVHDRGKLLNIMLTPGNTDDCTPVTKLLQQLIGRVFADKG